MANGSKRVMFVPDGGGTPLVGTLVELPPLTIWPNPPEGIAPLPEHPIVLPGDPSWEPPKPIDPPPGEGPPDVPPQNCRWVYTDKGWILVCGPYDKPRPPSR